MTRLLALTALAALALAKQAHALPLHAAVGAQWKPAVWPLPSAYSNGTTELSFGPNAGKPSFFAMGSGAAPAILDKAFARFAASAFPHTVGGASADAAAAVNGLSVTLGSAAEPYPQLETNETYTLTISATGSASLSAATVYGALHGLETFAQLVRFDFDRKGYFLAGAPWTISDSPRFPHRGLMVDTSRHFETLATLRGVIDSLAYAKLNVLHWHMSDSQSFPFQSKSHPKLWEASWSPQERYTQADIADTVEYGRLRGVRTMVEFDMPGHAGSWCKGYPDVCPSPTCTQPLNPASPTTFSLIEGLLNECTGSKPSTDAVPSGLFPYNLIHLGGDEVNTACWDSSPAVAKWLREQGLTADQGYGYFVNKSAHIAIAQGRRPIQWNEVYDHFGTALPKEAIVHAWNDRKVMNTATSAGYNAINSQGWYLDHLTTEWQDMYTNDPIEGITSKAAQGLVLGGQGEMWGETVDTSDMEQTVWPRLAAISEQLWSPREVTMATGATDSAAPRMAAFRCLLNRRGVAAAPLNNKGARTSPPGPGGCLTQ